MQTIHAISEWMRSNFLSLNPSITEFLLTGLPQQLAKLYQNSLLSDNTTSLPLTPPATLVSYSTPIYLLSNISLLFPSLVFYHVRDLRRIRSTLDFDTARTIATSLVHSKLDYCNSLYYNLPHVQIGWLQVIQNALARAVTNTQKCVHITPILKTLHWLNIRQRMEYKIISLTYTQHCNNVSHVTF